MYNYPREEYNLHKNDALFQFSQRYIFFCSDSNNLVLRISFPGNAVRTES